MSPAATLSVRFVQTTVNLASTATTLLVNTPATLTAALSPGTATGTVSFFQGTFPLGQAPVSGGSASAATSALALGSFPLTAVYSGDSYDAPATSPGLNSQVNAIPTGLSLVRCRPVCLTGRRSTSARRSHRRTRPARSSSWTRRAARRWGRPRWRAAQPAGVPVLFNVRVTTTLSSVPSGSVTIRTGAQTLGMGTLANGSVVASGGRAFVTVSVDSAALGLGSFSGVAAYYSGDTSDSASESSAAPASFAVVANPTSASLTLPASQLPLATAITLHASVTSSSGPPAGPVSFLVNGQAVATATLDSSGQAMVTLPALPAAAYAVSVSYPATGFYAASTSVPQTLTITPPVSVSFSPATLSLTAGSSADATLTVEPLSGFSGAISAVCSPSVSWMTCTLSAPASVGGGPVSAAVHITVLPNTLGSASLTPLLNTGTGAILAMLLPFLLGRDRRRRRVRLLMLALLTGLLATAVEGCANGGTFGSIPTGATPVAV